MSRPLKGPRMHKGPKPAPATTFEAFCRAQRNSIIASFGSVTRRLRAAHRMRVQELWETRGKITGYAGTTNLHRWDDE